MDESGRRIIHKQLPCDLAAILQLLKPYKKRIDTIAVESTYNWYWLVDGLQDHGYHVVLANPAAMQPYSGKKHTDDVSDAYFLAELLRLDLLPTGHLYDRKLRPVRDLLRREAFRSALSVAMPQLMMGAPVVPAALAIPALAPDPLVKRLVTARGIVEASTGKTWSADRARLLELLTPPA